MHQIGSDTREWLVPAGNLPASVQFGVSICGLSEARAGFQFRRFDFHGSQVLACTAGHGQVLLDGRWQACGSGQAYLCPPGVLHAYHHDGSDDPWHVAWIIYLAGSGPKFPATTQLIAADSQGLAQAIRGLHHELIGCRDGAAIGAWATLVDILGRRMVTGSQAQRLQAVWHAVAADPGRLWTLDQLARVIEVGPEQLRRLCKRDLGITPLAQVQRIRMQHAALLLSAGRSSVAEVAAAVGYANAFAFSTAFRRYHGCPPSRWGGPAVE